MHTGFVKSYALEMAVKYMWTIGVIHSITK